ncbi:hypothetical protein HYX17_01615 [Candidatus Woesearchaeota archaeon]|nr:hypothetical protein [Candidatus Woesearchaeota archaeon]
MKGTSQVDWAISIGIFLIYTIGLIIFLRPGLQPVMENNILISIIQDNLKDDVYATIEKTALFINTSDYTKESPPQSGLYKIEINDQLPFEGNKNEFAILDKDKNILNFDITQDKKLKFDGFVEQGKLNLFWILYFKGNNYKNKNPVELIDIDNQFNFSYSLGVKEDIQGIDFNKLKNLNPDVKFLKDDWNFPESKDFSIILANTTKKQYAQNDIIFSYNMKESLDQTDVFVKEWKDWIIGDKGELYGITLNVRVGEFE